MIDPVAMEVRPLSDSPKFFPRGTSQADGQMGLWKFGVLAHGRVFGFPWDAADVLVIDFVGPPPPLSPPLPAPPPPSSPSPPPRPPLRPLGPSSPAAAADLSTTRTALVVAAVALLIAFGLAGLMCCLVWRARRWRRISVFLSYRVDPDQVRAYSLPPCKSPGSQRLLITAHLRSA